MLYVRTELLSWALSSSTNRANAPEGGTFSELKKRLATFLRTVHEGGHFLIHAGQSPENKNKPTTKFAEAEILQWFMKDTKKHNKCAKR
jgi:hypothetical protein